MHSLQLFESFQWPFGYTVSEQADKHVQHATARDGDAGTTRMESKWRNVWE